MVSTMIGTLDMVGFFARRDLDVLPCWKRLRKKGMLASCCSKNTLGSISNREWIEVFLSGQVDRRHCVSSRQDSGPADVSASRKIFVLDAIYLCPIYVIFNISSSYNLIQRVKRAGVS